MPELTMSSLGISIQLDTDFDTALNEVTRALKEQGFGVLTEIDVKATLKEKLDVDFRPYKILGACNPPFAYRALQTDPGVGMLLPCNVTVSQEEDHCLVSILDPISMLSVIENPELKSIADEARERLTKVAASLEEGKRHADV